VSDRGRIPTAVVTRYEAAHHWPSPVTGCRRSAAAFGRRVGRGGAW